MKSNKLLFAIVLTLLIIAIIGIVIMALLMFKLQNEKLEIEKEMIKLNAEVTNNNNNTQKENLGNQLLDSNMVTPNSTNNTTQNNTNNNSNVSLTSIELSEISTFLNNTSNNTFLIGNYNKPEEIDLTNIFLGNEYHNSDGAYEEYQRIFNAVVTSPVLKVTSSKVKEVLKEKTGLQLADINSMKFDFRYASFTDAYYFIYSDDMYMPISCTGGYKSNNTYVVNYDARIGASVGATGTVTLKNVNGTYLFYANSINYI